MQPTPKALAGPGAADGKRRQPAEASGNIRRIVNVATFMKTRVQKWGNSLAVRIPQPFAKETNLSENSPVDVSLRNGKLIIAPVKEPDLDLEDLVARITKANRHEEVETGAHRGNEAW